MNKKKCYFELMDLLIQNTYWYDILNGLWKIHGIKIEEELKKQALLGSVFPKNQDIFRSFTFFSFNDLRVVLIGQDPYINQDEANGLCFSVNRGFKIPPSLRNVFKELHRCYDNSRIDTDLSDWAEQGVLLINTALTVRENKSGSHAKIWKSFTTDLIKYIGMNSSNVVFMLWGAHAQSYKQFINNENNLILEHSHPSPLSRKPFVGNNHFVLCNDYLKSKNIPIIKWIN
jgi:uracil-DNA glycosylase